MLPPQPTVDLLDGALEVINSAFDLADVISVLLEVHFVPLWAADYPTPLNISEGDLQR